MNSVGAPCSWVINNHDAVRSIDRYDLNLPPTGTTTLERLGDGSKINYKRGLNRSLSVMMLMMALPGDVYIYQGEELGIPEVRDIPDDRLVDPIWKQSNHRDRGRDGCRVPLPWNANPDDAYGFSSHISPESCWIPISDWVKNFSVESNMKNPNSTFHHYRKAIRTRKLANNDITQISEHDNILEFKRGQFHCITNFGTEHHRIPEHSRVLDSSAFGVKETVPPDTTVWLIDEE
jgi:alpha-glucosidase